MSNFNKLYIEHNFLVIIYDSIINYFIIDLIIFNS